MVSKNGFSALTTALSKQARHAQQRRTLVLSGTHGWCLDSATTAIATTESNVHIWISNAPTDNNTDNNTVIHYKPRQTRQLLGTEADTVVIDAHTGFNPDALGAVSGIIRAGGLLIILCPPLHRWRHLKDPEYNCILSYGYSPEDIHGYFIDRIARILGESRDTTLVKEGEPLPSTPCIPPTNTNSQPAPADNLCLTADQSNAVEAILRVANGHRRRPLVITADRGRGKTSALGIAAAQILRQKTGSILVTAPQPDAVKPLFYQAAKHLSNGEIRGYCIQHENHHLRFVAPDALSLNPHDAALVIVDEAAAIPAPILGKLLKKYARIVFSSTIHGYEGSGRGFALRFRETLDRITPQWRQLHLNTPIRWATGDPVEALTFALLLMNASSASDQRIMEITGEHDRIIKLSQQQLCCDEKLLKALYGLLITAHYQTTPRDLQRLMDSPDLSIYVLYRGQSVAGTVLTVKEGNIPQPLANAVWLGERRLRGHLTPQSLASHAGIATAAELSGERILRIAIHPCLRRQGLGKKLLQTVQADCHKNNRDFISSSFGATPELINFWKQSGLQVVLLGSTRDTSSGEHSALMLLPLTDAGNTLYTLARHRFIEQLPLLLCDSLRDIAPAIVATLATTCATDNDTINTPFTTQHWQDCLLFAFGNRTYDSCLFAIEKLLMTVLRDKSTQLSAEATHILILKVLQKHSWKAVVKQCNAKGEKTAVLQLRQAVAMLLRLHQAECPTSIHRTLQPMLDQL